MVSLSTGVATPVYTGELDRQAITALAGRQGVDASRFNTGLTRVLAEASVTPQVWTADLGGNMTCVGLGRLEGHWRIKEISVFIAREYPPGGCNYGRIREHEDEHVRIAHATFQAWTPRMEAALKDAAAAITPMVVPRNRNDAATAMTQGIMARMQPLLRGFQEDLRRQNAAIDTTASYRAIMGRCPSW